jgi:hypothetical protein
MVSTSSWTAAFCNNSRRKQRANIHGRCHSGLELQRQHCAAFRPFLISHVIRYAFSKLLELVVGEDRQQWSR